MLLAVAGSVGAALWFLKTRAPSPGPSLPAAVPAAAKNAVEPAEPAPAAITQEQIQQAVVEAPLLTRETAQALLVEAARRGQVPGHTLDSALFVASVGFPDLDQATLDELGGLISRSWSPRSAADQGRIQAYMQYARAGEPLSPAAVDAGRALFGEAVRALPAASRDRLRLLFAQAVTTGLRHQQQAEERSQLALLQPAPAAEPQPAARPRNVGGVGPRAGGGHPPSDASQTVGTSVAPAEEPGQPASVSTAGSVGSEASSTGDGESYWRSRATGVRMMVDVAEKRVRELEARQARSVPVTPGPLGPKCEDRVIARELRGQVVCDPNVILQEEARSVQAQLEQARKALSQAQRALEAFEEEARQGGALPGWLR